MREKRALKPTLIIGIVMIGLLAVLAIFAPLICSYDPLAQDLFNVLKGPGSPGHLLGTDQLGRDIFARLLYAGRTRTTSIRTAGRN